MEPQTGISYAALEDLAAELDDRDYEGRLVTPPGRPPFLHVRNRHANVLAEDIYAGHGAYWYSWAERIAPVECPSIAAGKIAQVLRAVGTPQ
jgi:hypothetical protein